MTRNHTLTESPHYLGQKWISCFPDIRDLKQIATLGCSFPGNIVAVHPQLASRRRKTKETTALRICQGALSARDLLEASWIFVAQAEMVPPVHHHGTHLSLLREHVVFQEPPARFPSHPFLEPFKAIVFAEPGLGAWMGLGALKSRRSESQDYQVVILWQSSCPARHEILAWKGDVAARSNATLGGTSPG